MERRIPRTKPGKHTRHSLLQGLGWIYLIILILLGWHLLSEAYPVLIPSPTSTYEAITRIGTDKILNAVITTLTNSLLGYLLGLIGSIALVIGAYLNKHIEALVNATNTFAQSISVLVWAIIFIMIFGVTSRKPPILVVAAATFPILLSSLIGAVRSLDEKFSLLAKMLGASKLQELFYFILPGTISYLAAASRAAIGIALRISVVAEAFGASGGVGYWLVYSYDIGFKEGVFAWASILIILMIAVDMLILRPIERWTMKWRL
ncbi:MAG: ABC transporter permease subunit [Desulfurococcales archaeon]|nr:ABC transporter permease subunit [Desulfurococcales archaeon]